MPISTLTTGVGAVANVEPEPAFAAVTANGLGDGLTAPGAPSQPQCDSTPQHLDCGERHTPTPDGQPGVPAGQDRRSHSDFLAKVTKPHLEQCSPYPRTRHRVMERLRVGENVGLHGVVSAPDS